MLFSTLFVVSAASIGVFSAPATLAGRQNIDLCGPTVPSKADSVLTGGKVTINAGNKLYWNATFPKRDFSQGFTDVKLANKINGKDWTVSEWYIEAAVNGTWKIK